ncbi:MAG: hypothetical protein R6V03_01880 [Kiritimatiellia bacterium]
MDYYLDAWIEWKKLCALNLCSTSAQVVLKTFAAFRFTKLMERYRAYADGPSSAPENPWHLLETHMTVKNTRGGKRLKDWLFARVKSSSDNALDVIQGGASLIMRDVAREYLRRECARPRTVSLDRPLPGRGTSSVTILDVLASGLDPSYETCLREYEDLARRHAGDFLRDMSRRERVALTAKRLGISLADSAVTKTAGCRKSVLFTAYRDLLARIASHLGAKYSADGAESVLTLTLMTLEEAASKVISRAKSEKSFSELFLLSEDPYETA